MLESRYPWTTWAFATTVVVALASCDGSQRGGPLVALLPGEGFVVGAHLSIVAEQSGFLLLFVNDTDEDNDEGGFDVRVVVEPGYAR
jgi:hypothetical protein